MVFLQHRERLSGLRGIWYELENKLHPRSQWRVKHKFLFPSLDTEEVREEAGEPGTRNCPARLGPLTVLQVDHLHFYLQGAWVPPACPHFPQPSSLIVHSVVFHPLRVKFRGVVTLCDISYSWCLRTQPWEVKYAQGQFSRLWKQLAFVHKTQGNCVPKERIVFSVFDLAATATKSLHCVRLCATP